MDLTVGFVPRSRDVASEDFNGEYVVLDLESGKYFGLLDGSAIVWRGLMAGHSLTTLCAGIPEGDPRLVEIGALVATLVEHQLLIPAASPVGNEPAEVVAALAASKGPYPVEMFDDLADLLLADPIHDVDQEAGWPFLRPAQD